MNRLPAPSRICCFWRDAVVVADLSGRVLDFNGAAETIFGYRRADALGRRMSDIIVPPHLRDAHEAGMERYRRTRERHVIGKGRIEMEAMRRSGEIFPVEFSLSSTESADGEIFVSFIRDISAKKAAETELLKARDEALAGEKAKANLLAVMSHEMRTPLNGMLGALELISDDELSQKQRDYLRIMETSGRLLLQHVNDVLDISQVDADCSRVAYAPFSLATLVREVAEMQQPIAAKNHNELAWNVQDSASSVIGDAPKLRQILVNLVGNAIKFTHAGHVTVEAERLSGGNMVEIRVIDDGIGIREADQEHVFDEFFTGDPTYRRAAGGTGLGLAITARLVKLLGGKIGLESEENEGSLFWVRLPLPDADVAAQASDPTPCAKRPVARDGLRILLVEDNEINRQVARAMLTSLGHDVTEAVDGADGAEAANTVAYDVVLMDISMPRLDGIGATRLIREGGASKNACIIALTAHAMPNEIVEFRAAGIDDIVTKPVSRALLAEALRRAAPEDGEAGAAAAADNADPFAELESMLGPDAAAAAWPVFIDEGAQQTSRIGCGASRTR